MDERIVVAGRHPEHGKRWRGTPCVLRLESRAEASSLMAVVRRSLPWHHTSVTTSEAA